TTSSGTALIRAKRRKANPTRPSRPPPDAQDSPASVTAGGVFTTDLKGANAMPPDPHAQPVPSATAEVEIFTDGACSGNPGPGGWAAILRYRETDKELSGFDPDTTNNRMEMTAAIVGLETLKRPCRVRLYSDSQYLRDGITKWIHGWNRRNWVTADKQPCK